MTAEATLTPMTVPEGVVAPLSSGDRWRILLFGGGLLILVNFSGPMNGFIDVPVTFFLKNRMHLTANQLAVFKVWVGAPLFLSFVFGFIRDRWSPFSAGDRGHVAVFGLITAAIYAAVAFITPTYMVFLLGLVIVTITFQMASSAAAGLIAAIGQNQAMAGQMGVLVNIGVTFPQLCAYLLGGILSGALEGRDAVTAAKTVFLCAAGLMIVIALFGLSGPKALFANTGAAPAAATIRADIKRLLKHWPVYPVMLIQVLWQFGPASGTVLQYHITNHLHASDAQWGAWNAIFVGSFLPVFVIYGFLCQRVRLSRLLWWGFGLGVIQMAPLLFVKTAIGALIAAVPMGLIGGIAQAALVDLTIRACPKGLRATMMMLIISMYWVATRFGDLFGTWIYDGHGGFIGAVIATIFVYALILPVIFLLPRSLIDTTDGEPLEIKG